jgi:hypothetical protein
MKSLHSQIPWPGSLSVHMGGGVNVEQGGVEMFQGWQSGIQLEKKGQW